MKRLFLLTKFNIVCFIDGEEFKFIDISEWFELNSKIKKKNKVMKKLAQLNNAGRCYDHRHVFMLSKKNKKSM